MAPPPRKRVQFSQENIDQQLQQIHFLDPSSSSENLEQLAPIIKQIHQSRQQDAFLRTVQGLVQSKDAEIETVCGDNYQDFITSVSTLFTIKSHTTNLREKISTLDTSVSQVGRTLVEKKKALLQSKKTAENLDDAIDTLQSFLRVLDVVNRVGKMIQDGKYWSSLRSLEEIRSMPNSTLSQTPVFQYLLSSLPSLRTQIKDAVTASMKQWLLEIRNISGNVGELALETMEGRAKRWRTRREKDAMLRHNRVGSAVETVTYEKVDFSVFDNDKMKVDFTPLYESIHIYQTLDSLDELQKSYQADRKSQAELILPTIVNLSNLTSLTQELAGFFIVEHQVFKTTRSFRSERDIDDLWDSVVGRMTAAIEIPLNNESDPEIFLRVKETLLSFIVTLESFSYSTTRLHNFVLTLFGKYTSLLEKQIGGQLEEIIRQDDCVPMAAEDQGQLDHILGVVWTDRTVRDQLTGPPPVNLSWSQGFYECCRDIRSFVQKFYQFIEGVSQHHRNIDELLGNSLDNLLKDHICATIEKRLSNSTALSQIAQIITNVEHFVIAFPELELSLTTLRSSQRGGTVSLNSTQAFEKAKTVATTRINFVIRSKLDDFFELPEYNWTTQRKEDTPSMYLYELINWLTTVVDSLVVKDSFINETYKSSVEYIAEYFMDYLTNRNIPMINENAISNLLLDVDFIESELKNIGRADLTYHFNELRSMASVPLSDVVQQYLVPAVRQASYPTVRPKRLQVLLEKLAKYGQSSRNPAEREKGDRRRKEADAVGRIYPGENR